MSLFLFYIFFEILKSHENGAIPQINCTALKASVKLNTLSGYLKHESLNKIAFEDKTASLQDTLHSLRENLKSISDQIMKLPENEFEEAMKDLETNENDFEQKEENASNLKCAFNLTFLKIIVEKEPNKSIESETKRKFKPRDFTIPKWNGEIVNYNVCKFRLKNYFQLTGLISDAEQLTIFFL